MTFNTSDAHAAVTDISETHGFVGVIGMANHWGVSRQRAQKLTKEDGFPKPVIQIYSRSDRPTVRLWLLTEIHEWRAKRGDRRFG